MFVSFIFSLSLKLLHWLALAFSLPSRYILFTPPWPHLQSVVISTCTIAASFNQVHHHAYQTILQMINGLPQLNPGHSKSSSCVAYRFWLIVVDLKTHSIFTLYLMAIQYEKYRLKGHEMCSSNAMAHGHSIAQEIVKKLGHDTVNNDHPYFTRRNYLDPGDDFEWHSAFVQWQTIPETPALSWAHPFHLYNCHAILAFQTTIPSWLVSHSWCCNQYSILAPNLLNVVSCG